MLALQLAGILGSADGLGHTVSLLVPDSATSPGGPPSDLPYRVERYSTRRRDASQIGPFECERSSGVTITGQIPSSGTNTGADERTLTDRSCARRRALERKVM